MVRCGVCGHGLSGKPQYKATATRRERLIYFCPAHRGGCGKVATNIVGVDAQVRLLVIERLSSREHAAQVTAFTSTRATRLTQVRAELAQAEQLQEALAERLGRQEMTLGAFDAANAPVVKTLAALVAERDSLESGELGPLEVATAAEITAEWDALVAAGDVGGLRAMLRRALGDEIRHARWMARFDFRETLSRQPDFWSKSLKANQVDLFDSTVKISPVQLNGPWRQQRVSLAFLFTF